MIARWPSAGTPTDAENRELIRRSQDGDDAARDECVRRNRPLAVSLATRLRASWRYGISFHDKEDLIQEGMIGLSEAISRFDPSRNIRLSTHAYPWIRKAMIRWLYQHIRTVRVPDYLQYADAEDHANLEPFVRVAMAPNFSIFDAHPATGLSFADSIPAREEDDPPEDHGERDEAIRAAIERLGDRQREILSRRFYSRHTLAAIGEDLDLTRERVRQIERESIRTLRRALMGKWRRPTSAGEEWGR